VASPDQAAETPVVTLPAEEFDMFNIPGATPGVEEPKPTLAEGQFADSNGRIHNADGSFAKVTPEPTSAETPETPATPKPSHPATLIEAAKSFGMTDDEIGDPSTNPRLHDQVWRLHSVREAARERAESFRANSDGPAKRADAAPPAPEPEENFGLPEEELVGIHKPLLTVMQKLAKENKELKKAIEEQGGTLKKVQFDARTEAVIEALDEAFEKIGDPYYGEGSGTQMQSTSEELQNRQALFDAAGIDILHDNKKTIVAKIIAKNRRFRGDKTPTPPKQELGIYGQPKVPSNGTTPKPSNGTPPVKRYTEEEWLAAGLAKPTHTGKSALPNGRQKAIESVAKLQGRQPSDNDSPSDVDDMGFLE
jgi:hypothetical protein